MFISSGPEAVCASILFCTIVLIGCCFVLLCVSDVSPCQADATLLEAPEIEADDSFGRPTVVGTGAPAASAAALVTL